MVAYHLLCAAGPEQFLDFFDLQGRRAGGVLVEVVAASLRLKSVELAAEANVEPPPRHAVSGRLGPSSRAGQR